ncbi:MAG: type II secretion system protein N [Sphingomonadales bacterium]|nr:type II secretion system protein N [Sphingomonadales bacterium]
MRLAWNHKAAKYALATAAILAALMIFMPLRAGLSMALPANSSITARAAAGTIWDGHLAGIKIGQVAIGDMDLGLAFWPLWTGRAEFHFAPMENGTAQPMNGRIGTVMGGQYVRELNGSLPLDGVDARLPLSHLEMTEFSVAFDSGSCRRASGTVRLILKPGGLDALGLNNGFLGQAKCDQNALLLPLVSQSSNERADIRLLADGSYTAAITIQNDTPEIGPALSAAGFTPIAEGYRMIIKGRL